MLWSGVKVNPNSPTYVNQVKERLNFVVLGNLVQILRRESWVQQLPLDITLMLKMKWSSSCRYLQNSNDGTKSSLRYDSKMPGFIQVHLRRVIQLKQEVQPNEDLWKTNKLAWKETNTKDKTAWSIEASLRLGNELNYRLIAPSASVASVMQTGPGRSYLTILNKSTSKVPKNTLLILSIQVYFTRISI